MGYRYDMVEAILAERRNAADPAAAAEAVKQLQAWVERDDWERILPGYARCVRIIRSAKVEDRALTVDETQFVEQAERDLHQAIQSSVDEHPTSVDALLNVVLKLIPSINLFFDKVLVMAEDEKIRQNRLALVGQVAGLAAGIVDLSKLEGF
jgi:glycyl-tRNA synthetase